MTLWRFQTDLILRVRSERYPFPGWKRVRKKPATSGLRAGRMVYPLDEARSAGWI
jgi:hypothetical protein